MKNSHTGQYDHTLSKKQLYQVTHSLYPEEFTPKISLWLQLKFVILLLLRQKLLSEFEVWYNDSFGVSISAGTEKVDISDTLTQASSKDDKG